jgi:hypothetical protein
VHVYPHSTVHVDEHARIPVLHCPAISASSISVHRVAVVACFGSGLD